MDACIRTELRAAILRLQTSQLNSITFRPRIKWTPAWGSGRLVAILAVKYVVLVKKS